MLANDQKYDILWLCGSEGLINIMNDGCMMRLLFIAFTALNIGYLVVANCYWLSPINCALNQLVPKRSITQMIPNFISLCYRSLWAGAWLSEDGDEL